MIEWHDPDFKQALMNVALALGWTYSNKLETTGATFSHPDSDSDVYVAYKLPFRIHVGTPNARDYWFEVNDVALQLIASTKLLFVQHGHT